MSMDVSLKIKSGMSRHRNVLTRAERIAKLEDADKWVDERSPFGLPKVGHRKVAVGTKKKKKTEGEEAADAKPAKGKK